MSTLALVPVCASVGAAVVVVPFEPDVAGIRENGGLGRGLDPPPPYWNVAKALRVARSKNGHAPKICTVCARPFEWRAKWRDSFDEVKYCSKACSREAARARRATT